MTEKELKDKEADILKRETELKAKEEKHNKELELLKKEADINKREKSIKELKESAKKKDTPKLNFREIFNKTRKGRK